jgi:hypothetical protein
MGKPGRKLTPYVVIEFPIKLRKMANEEVDRYTSELSGSVKKAASSYRQIGRRHGITKGARAFLRGA